MSILVHELGINQMAMSINIIMQCPTLLKPHVVCILIHHSLFIINLSSCPGLFLGGGGGGAESRLFCSFSHRESRECTLAMTGDDSLEPLLVTF